MGQQLTAPPWYTDNAQVLAAGGRAQTNFTADGGSYQVILPPPRAAQEALGIPQPASWVGDRPIYSSLNTGWTYGDVPGQPMWKGSNVPVPSWGIFSPNPTTDALVTTSTGSATGGAATITKVTTAQAAASSPPATTVAPIKTVADTSAGTGVRALNIDRASSLVPPVLHPMAQPMNGPTLQAAPAPAPPAAAPGGAGGQLDALLAWLRTHQTLAAGVFLLLLVLLVLAGRR